MRKTRIKGMTFANFKVLVTSAIIAFCFALPNDILATHIVGGNLYYNCLGDNYYEFTFVMRRDCENGADDAPFDEPYIYLTIFDMDGNFLPRRGDNGYIRLELISNDTLPTDLDDFCITSGDLVCVHQAVYKATVLLPDHDDGYIMAYQRCCRNVILDNIEDPLETGATWTTTLTPEAMAACNSTPVFKKWPPIYICLNDPLTFEHDATDPDGDSLVYSLCTPLTGATRMDPRPTKSTPASI